MRVSSVLVAGLLVALCCAVAPAAADNVTTTNLFNQPVVAKYMKVYPVNIHEGDVELLVEVDFGDWNANPHNGTEIFLRKNSAPTRTQFERKAFSWSGTNALRIRATDPVLDFPLSAGTYYVGVYVFPHVDKPGVNETYNMNITLSRGECPGLGAGDFPCFMHGVCLPNHQCLCTEGWALEDCSAEWRPIPQGETNFSALSPNQWAFHQFSIPSENVRQAVIDVSVDMTVHSVGQIDFHADPISVLAAQNRLPNGQSYDAQAIVLSPTHMVMSIDYPDVSVGDWVIGIRNQGYDLRYAILVETHNCRWGCNGNGDCLDGKCNCTTGWTGDSCDLREAPLQDGVDEIWMLEPYQVLYAQIAVSEEKFDAGMSLHLAIETNQDVDGLSAPQLFVQSAVQPTHSSFIARSVLPATGNTGLYVSNNYLEPNVVYFVRIENTAPYTANTTLRAEFVSNTPVPPEPEPVPYNETEVEVSGTLDEGASVVYKLEWNDVHSHQMIVNLNIPFNTDGSVHSFYDQDILLLAKRGSTPSLDDHDARGVVVSASHMLMTATSPVFMAGDWYVLVTNGDVDLEYEIDIGVFDCAYNCHYHGDCIDNVCDCSNTWDGDYCNVFKQPLSLAEPTSETASSATPLQVGTTQTGTVRRNGLDVYSFTVTHAQIAAGKNLDISAVLSTPQPGWSPPRVVLKYGAVPRRDLYDAASPQPLGPNTANLVSISREGLKAGTYYIGLANDFPVDLAYQLSATLNNAGSGTGSGGGSSDDGKVKVWVVVLVSLMVGVVTAIAGFFLGQRKGRSGRPMPVHLQESFLGEPM